MKMPKPRAWIYTHKGMSMASTNRVHGVKAAPLYDKQALIDLLEEAAKECDQERVAHLMFKNYQAAMALANVADSFRSMKETL